MEKPPRVTDGLRSAPIPITRSETNPYPTTFVQADTSSFKQVVQMLTGSTETAKQAASRSPFSDPTRKSQSGFKLYERRNALKDLKISPLPSGSVHNSVLSPSMLDFPSLVLSPVTPLVPDLFNRSPNKPAGGVDSEAEERAIAEKGFYLHSSPRDSEPPRLLSLFPLTSTKFPGS